MLMIEFSFATEVSEIGSEVAILAFRAYGQI